MDGRHGAAEEKELTMTTTMQNEIVTEMFTAAGLSGRDVPAVSDDGSLTDGNYSEPAAQDEAGLRAQCAQWIAAVADAREPTPTEAVAAWDACEGAGLVRDDGPEQPSAPADGSMWCSGCGALLWAESTGRQPQPAAWHDSAPWCAGCEDAPSED